MINSETESPLSLQSVAFIGAGYEGTLSFSSSMFLPRFSRVQTLVSVDNSADPYDILSDSSYTFILIGKSSSFYISTYLLTMSINQAAYQ